MRINSSKISRASIVFGIVVALFMSLATELVLRQVRREETQETAQIQENALKLLWELLHGKGEEFRLQGGELWIGAYRINGSSELLDKVKELTGSSATVFQGDTRVATTIRVRSGQRVLGSKLTGQPHEALFRRGVPFRGDTEILGSTYYGAYDPIIDRQGRVIGAVFAGAPQRDYLAAYRRTAFRIRTINGILTCIFILCAFLLLAERRKRESAIRKQLDFLQVIIDTIPSPVFYKDTAGRYLGFNEIFAASVGLPREEMLGKTAHDLWNRRLAEQFQSMDQELYSSPGVRSYEVAMKDSKGDLHQVIMNKGTFRNPNGSIGGLVGVMQDITERKAAEEETRNAYRKMADILEFLPDATFVVDQESRVIAWNLAIEQMTGVKKEEILGNGNYAYALPFYRERRRLLIDLLNEDSELQERLYPQVRRNGKTLIAEAKVRMPQGERHLWSVASPLYDLQGNQVGGIQTLRDVTEIRLAQQERDRLELQLQHSGMITSLMSQLSHDLRTPLTPLFALLPMVDRQVSDPKLKRMLGICQESVAQIQGLTGKALDLVRLSKRQDALELTRVQLFEIAGSSLNGASPLFEQRGITCLNEIDPALCVRGATEQLALLFDNLFSNAARYAAEHGVVRIRASREGQTVTVSVQDDGAGLEHRHLDLVFREFFKVDSARHDAGTQGLGLAICKSIVLNHQGSIWAESPGLNLGTTIFFTLQACDAA